MNLHLYCKILTRVLPNFNVSAKFSNPIRCSFFPSFKLSSWDLKICYQQPYWRQVWHFKEAETNFMRRALHDFNWERAFSNTIVSEKVCIFNKSVLNVLSNFIPHEIILCNDQGPPWFNSQIKSLLQTKNKVFKSYRKNKTNMQLLNKFNFLQERLSSLLTKFQTIIVLIKMFLNNNNNNNKKILLTPQQFHDKKIVTDFLEKAELFN